MSATMELLGAALFTGHALMMVVLFSTMYRDLPHARQRAILHATGDGALAVSATVQALRSFGGRSSQLAVLSLLLAICGFLIVFAIPVLTTIWLSNNRQEQRWRWHRHREEPHSDRQPEDVGTQRTAEREKERSLSCEQVVSADRCCMTCSMEKRPLLPFAYCVPGHGLSHRT